MTIKRKKKSQILYVILLTIIIALSNFQTAVLAESKTYIPAGVPFGIRINCEGLLVTGFIINEEFTKSNNPAIQAGIIPGDVITKVDGVSIDKPDVLYERISASCGKKILLTVIRNNEEQTITIKPKLCQNGKYKIGIHLKNSITGIGTLTYYCPEDNTFGGLGHGICDANAGNVIRISGGDVYRVTINGVNKGTKGQAGEIKGNFNSDSVGRIKSNTSFGVFGVIDRDFVTNKKAYETAEQSEITCGDVTIISTLDKNGPSEYSAKIESINYEKNYRNYIIRITDQRLIEKSGGIIQGMSGSPIIQNGKLIGAVTHVLVNDPTMGYGIFIDNMIKAS